MNPSLIPLEPEDPEDQLAPAVAEASSALDVQYVPDVQYPEEWGLNTKEKKKGLANQLAAKKSIKYGLLAGTPLLCRNHDCPFKAFCEPQKRGEVEVGDRCVLEIAKMVDGQERYNKEFNVDPLDPEQRVDSVMISQLLSLEILMDRCNMLLAQGSLVEEIDVAMNPQGDVIQQPQLHKAAEALPKLQRRHNEVLVQLSATRKEKFSRTDGASMGIDQFTKQMIERAQIIEARMQMMREGKLVEANDAGIQYGITQNTKLLPIETINTVEVIEQDQ